MPFCSYFLVYHAFLIYAISYKASRRSAQMRRPFSYVHKALICLLRHGHYGTRITVISGGDLGVWKLEPLFLGKYWLYLLLLPAADFCMISVAGL